METSQLQTTHLWAVKRRYRAGQERFRGSKEAKEIVSYVYIINIGSKFRYKMDFQSNEEKTRFKSMLTIIN